MVTGAQDQPPRAVPLGKATRAHIDALPDGRSVDAGLDALRIHDLRHTMASHAVMSGENLPLVGRLLKHRRHRTTAGYAQLTDGQGLAGATSRR